MPRWMRSRKPTEDLLFSIIPKITLETKRQAENSLLSIKPTTPLTMRWEGKTMMNSCSVPWCLWEPTTFSMTSLAIDGQASKIKTSNLFSRTDGSETWITSWSMKEMRGTLRMDKVLRHHPFTLTKTASSPRKQWQLRETLRMEKCKRKELKSICSQVETEMWGGALQLMARLTQRSTNSRRDNNFQKSSQLE